MIPTPNQKQTTGLVVNYDRLEREDEKMLALLAYIGKPVNVSRFIQYANIKLGINTTAKWLMDSTLAPDLRFVTPDNSGELSVAFNGTASNARYSDNLQSILNAIEGSPASSRTQPWLSPDLTIDAVVNLPEFGVLNSESKLYTLQNYFGPNAAKLVAGYFVLHERDKSAIEKALGRFGDLYTRHRTAWPPDSFLSQVELNVITHQNNRHRDRDTILAEIRDNHANLLALINELGKL